MAGEKFQAEMNDEIVQNFRGITTIKLLRRERYTLEKFCKDISARKYKNEIKKNVWYSLYVVFYDVMVIIVPILVLIAGFILSQRNVITVGAIIAIYSLVGLLQEPIRNIADSVTYFKEHRNRIKKLGELTWLQETVDNETSINSITLRVDKIKFQNANILENISLKIEAGDIISLCGESGSGKSTLLKILLGMQSLFEGECLYDGIPQKELPENILYKNISLVEQKPFLFSASIRENIMLGEDFEEKVLQDIIHVCVLDDVIAQYGLDKKIDWLGSNISGGEMQRVAIARILIRKPNFLLLDEITASLDEKMSNKLAKNIVEYARVNKMTLVVVSHKNEFMLFSNKKLELNKTDGRCAE